MAPTDKPVVLTSNGLSEWRCFHCDEVFTDEAKARAHFGETPASITACQPSDDIVRNLLKQIRALNREVERLKAHGNETGERRETGWLIEDGGHNPRYRTMVGGNWAWTSNANEAIRFARRVDAEMVSREDEDAWRIVEPQWITLDGDQLHALKAKLVDSFPESKDA